MDTTTQHISLRLPKWLVETAEREALRLDRKRSWVLASWAESGYLQLMPAGVDSDGTMVDDVTQKVIESETSSVDQDVFNGDAGSVEFHNNIKYRAHNPATCRVYRCGLCKSAKDNA